MFLIKGLRSLIHKNGFYPHSRCKIHSAAAMFRSEEIVFDDVVWDWSVLWEVALVKTAAHHVFKIGFELDSVSWVLEERFVIFHSLFLFAKGRVMNET